MSAENSWSKRISRFICDADFVQCAIMALFGMYWTSRAPDDLHLSDMLFWVELVGATWLIGRATLSLFRLSRPYPITFPLNMLVGGVVIGSMITVFKLYSSASVSQLFLLLVAASIAILLRSSLASQFHSSTESARDTHSEILSTLIAMIAATIWTEHHYPLIVDRSGSLFFLPYSEMFYHAMRTSPLLVDGNPIDIGSFQFADHKLPMYHYASYAFPALASSIGQQPAWLTVSTVWHPLGLFWLGLGAFCLGNSITGSRGGLWATVCVLVLPDPYLWGIEYGSVMLSFHRFIEASPGLPYGCAIAAAAMSLFITGIKQNSINYWLLGFCAVGSCMLFRVNVFLPLYLLSFLVMVYWRTSVTKSEWLISVWLLLTAAGVLLYLRTSNRPTLDPGFDFGIGYATHLLEADNRFAPAITALFLRHDILGFVMRILLFTLIMLGPFAALFIAAWFVPNIIQRDEQHLRLFPAFVLAISLCMSFFLGVNRNGDPYELIHRQFAWMYTALVAWTAAILCKFRWISFSNSTGNGIAVCSLLLPLAIVKFGGLQLENAPIARGLMESCAYIREHSDSLDIVAVSDNDPRWKVGGQTQRRMFVCTSPDDIIPGGNEFRPVMIDRAAKFKQLMDATSFESISDWYHCHRVRWIVVLPGTDIKWPRSLDRPSFEKEGCRVYDLELLTR